MRIMLWIVFGIGLAGAPLMMIMLVKTGNPLAILNAIWSLGIAGWALALLPAFEKRRSR